jgi:hypothetical protein
VLARIIVKVLIFLGASVFSYSLWVVGIRDGENMKLLGSGLSLLLALSVILAIFYDFNR